MGTAFFANSRMERIEGTQVTTVFVNRPWIAALATGMAVLATNGQAQGSETYDQLHTEFDYFSLS